MPPSATAALPETVGRYTLHHPIASGGMATVYFGKLSGPLGFSKIVAVKRMHRRFAEDPQFVAMFVDEATLASRVNHPNVVPTLDVVAQANEILIVMDYVRGASLSALLTAAVRAEAPVPIGVAAAVIVGVLSGLHAAHEASDKKGRPLGLVHRDVSPHNVLVGVDGVARIMDFGVAKATHRLNVTQEGEIKGKLSYMAPEQLRSAADVDRRVDVFAAGVVLWNTLAGRRLFVGNDVTDTMEQVLRGEIPRLSTVRADVPAALEAAVARALERDRAARFATAQDFAVAIEEAVALAPPRAVGEWVQSLTQSALSQRDAVVAEMEDTGVIPAPSAAPAGDAREATTSASAPTIADAPEARARDSRGEDEPSASSAPTRERVVGSPEEPTLPGSELNATPVTQTRRGRGPIAIAVVVFAAAVVAVGARLAASTSDTPAAEPLPSLAASAPASPPPSPSPSPSPSASPSASLSASTLASAAPPDASKAAPRDAAKRPPRAPVPASRSARPAARPGDPGYLPPRP